MSKQGIMKSPHALQSFPFPSFPTALLSNGELVGIGIGIGCGIIIIIGVVVGVLCYYKRELIMHTQLLSLLSSDLNLGECQ